MRNVVAIVTALCLSLAFATQSRAQTVVPTVSYVGGWNLVGGPAGTDFSGAQGLFSYDGSSYLDVPGRHSSTCQGYWAYFLGPHSVTLTIQTSTAVTCPLRAGWNLIGNPFDGVAYLPLNATAYAWNTANSAYSQVYTIAPGGAVWVYSAAAGSISLETPAPGVNPPPPTLLISASSQGSTYSVHVGDTIELLAPSAVPYIADWDQNYLQLIQQGSQGELTCVGDPACQFNPTNGFWYWKAIAAGTTAIVLNPTCRMSTPACELASRVFQIVITP